MHFDPGRDRRDLRPASTASGTWTAPGGPRRSRSGSGSRTTTFALDDVRAAARPAGGQRARAQHRSRGRAPRCVQVYGGYVTSAYERPASRLVGFARVRARARRTARTSAVPVDLAMLDVRVDGRMHREPGTVRLRVAFDAADPGVDVTEVSV